MRLIDKDALWQAFDSESWYDNADRDEIVLPIVDSFPTVDAVCVVRCKDCKYYVSGPGDDWCDLARGLVCPMPNDFCSRGERKEVE